MGIQYLLNRVLRRAIGCGLLIGAFYHGQVTSLQGAEPVDNWAEYPRPEGVSGLVSIAYGNNLFVAAGTNGTIVSSTNGMDWIKVDAGMSGGPGRVRFVNDRFFVSGFAPGPIMSSNGTDWSPVGVFYNDITFANGAYYTVLWTQVGRSTNLTDWTHFTAPSGFRNIAYGNGAFVANGGESFSYVHYSTDGEQWLQVESSSDPGMTPEIVHENGYFSSVRRVFFQMPQITPPPAPGMPPIIFYLPKTAYALKFSVNGGGWSIAFRIPDGVSAIPSKMAAGGQYFVLPAGNSIFYTTNLAGADPVYATNWAGVNVTVPAPENGAADIAFGNQVFVAILHGKIFNSNPVSGFAPLRILAQPTSFSATMGGSAIFSVAVQGSDPATYQWRYNGTNIAGATERTYTVTNVTMEAAGEYDVVITNPAGSVTSEKAVLSVHFADVKLYAGVTLRGQIGDKFKIEHRDELEGNEAWQEATNVTMTASESIWIDYDSPTGTNRFYRATYIGR